MDGDGRLRELQRRCADLEALNAQLARDLAAATERGRTVRPRGATAAGLHVSDVERRLADALAQRDALALAQRERDQARAALEELGMALEAARDELASAKGEALAGWHRYYELRNRAAVRLALRLARRLSP